MTEDDYDPFAEMSKKLDYEFNTEKLPAIANISITIPDQYYPDNDESSNEADFLVHGGKKLSPSELHKYRVESSENRVKALAKELIKEQTDMHLGRIDVNRVFNNGLLIDYNLIASRSDEKTKTPQIIYHDREATKYEKEEEEKGWQDWANQTELPKVTYTLADMRAWYKLLGDGQPYHSILYFGHGKARIWGEGWSGGEMVSGRAHATERAFIKLLGQQLYAKYMNELMEAPHTVKQQLTTKHPHLTVPLQKEPATAVSPNTIPVQPIIAEEIKQAEQAIKKLPKVKKHKERLPA